MAILCCSNHPFRDDRERCANLVELARVRRRQSRRLESSLWIAVTLASSPNASQQALSPRSPLHLATRSCGLSRRRGRDLLPRYWCVVSVIGVGKVQLVLTLNSSRRVGREEKLKSRRRYPCRQILVRFVAELRANERTTTSESILARRQRRRP